MHAHAGTPVVQHLNERRRYGAIEPEAAENREDGSP